MLPPSALQTIVTIEAMTETGAKKKKGGVAARGSAVSDIVY